MHDLSTVDQELIAENSALKRRIRDLEHSDAERKTAEAGLRESEEKYRLLVESMMAGVFQSTLTGTFLHVNRAAVAMAGYESPEELLSQPATCLYADPADRERLSRMLSRDGEVRNMEMRSQRKDGTQYWISMNAALQRDSDGRPAQIIGIVHDITDRQRAEAEKAMLEAQLRQAHKMESVGRLAGGVAHDFNNMLAVILGHAELALDAVDSGHPLQADLQEIRAAATRSADLTRQLLAFARQQTITPRVLDLNVTVAGTIKMLGPLIGEDIRISWLPAGDLWSVRIDPAQIDQILTHLCVNARDAIAGVGTITMRTDNVSFDVEDCAGLAGMAPGPYVRLMVSDDGCGMDKETLSHVFEPFFTTKPLGQGTGMGLASVYGAVKQNGGFIQVRSELGAGTTFTIYLPSFVAQIERPGTDDGAGRAVQGRELILVVEDEPSVLNLTGMILERQGYTVLKASTPAEAIRLSAMHAGQIHLLVTDVVMPDMNGRTLAAHLLSGQPDLKRLFISGYTADVIADHGVVEAGVHFLQKPFSIRELSAAVRETLESD